MCCWQSLVKICSLILVLNTLSHHKLSCAAVPALRNLPSGNNLQKLSVAQWDHYSERDVQGPDTYVFGYDVEDPQTNNVHFRHEERLPNGTIVGSYGYVTPDGNAHHVRYSADHRGYRATVETTRRFADVKPIPVNVEQDLADEISSVVSKPNVDETTNQIQENTNQFKQPTSTRAHQSPIRVLPVAVIQQPGTVYPPTLLHKEGFDYSVHS